MPAEPKTFTAAVLLPTKWKGMHPDIVGRLVAYVIRTVEGCTNVEISREGLRVTVAGDVFPADLAEKIYAVAEAPLASCPCGCGADMLLGVCYREETGSQYAGAKSLVLLFEEENMVRLGNTIGAIRSIRERLRVGLQEAKGAVDVYRRRVLVSQGL
jgi:hypothetical protein